MDNYFVELMNDAIKNRNPKLTFGPLFKEERTYFPINIKNKNPKNKKIKVSKLVERFIKQHGFKIKNYENGIAIDKYKRQVKIGKILEKHGATATTKKRFNERLKGQTNKPKNYMVVFSYKPEDILLMSTNRGWTSCLNVKDPDSEERFSVFDKISCGGMVAYLIDEKDRNILKPISRISIRRFVDFYNQNGFILIPNNKVYGMNSVAFSNFVQKKLEESNYATYKGNRKGNWVITFKDGENGYSEEEDTIIFPKQKNFKNYSGSLVLTIMNSTIASEIKVKNATFSISIVRGNYSIFIDWKKGEWLHGVFYGDWNDGIWHDGLFVESCWKKGIWHNGTLNNAQIKKGTFKKLTSYNSDILKRNKTISIPDDKILLEKDLKEIIEKG